MPVPRTRSDPEGFAPSWSSPLTPKEQAVQVEKRRFNETLRIYKALFLPCKKDFGNGVFKVSNGHDGHPENVIEVKKYFAENFEVILSEPVPKCGCTTEDERQLVSEARSQLKSDGDLLAFVETISHVVATEKEYRQEALQHYLDTLRKVMPEMLGKD